ncbi:MAG: hypothetical protein K8I27_00365 [Planctomycetes bacterium]|nr:hypothetical protein [Planctomycetota bacterium]
MNPDSVRKTFGALYDGTATPREQAAFAEACERWTELDSEFEAFGEQQESLDWDSGRDALSKLGDSPPPRLAELENSIRNEIDSPASRHSDSLRLWGALVATAAAIAVALVIVFARPDDEPAPPPNPVADAPEPAPAPVFSFGTEAVVDRTGPRPYLMDGSVDVVIREGTGVRLDLPGHQVSATGPARFRVFALGTMNPKLVSALGKRSAVSAFGLAETEFSLSVESGSVDVESRAERITIAAGESRQFKSAEQEARVKSRFDLLDKDRSGTLEQSEVSPEVFAVLGRKNRPVSFAQFLRSVASLGGESGNNQQGDHQGNHQNGNQDDDDEEDDDNDHQDEDDDEDEQN